MGRLELVWTIPREKISKQLAYYNDVVDGRSIEYSELNTQNVMYLLFTGTFLIPFVIILEHSVEAEQFWKAHIGKKVEFVRDSTTKPRENICPDCGQPLIVKDKIDINNLNI